MNLYTDCYAASVPASYRHSQAATSIKILAPTLNSCAAACLGMHRAACASFSFSEQQSPSLLIPSGLPPPNCLLSPNGKGDLGSSDGQVLRAQGWRVHYRVRAGSKENCTQLEKGDLDGREEASGTGKRRVENGNDAALTETH